MKFVRISAALSLALAATACGGGGGEDVAGTGGADTNASSGSKDTTGASLAVPGSGTSADNGSQPSTQNAEAITTGNDSNAAPADPGTAPTDPAPAAPADPAAPAAPADPAAAAPAAPAAPPKTYVPAECDADCRAHDIPGVIERASKKYNIPRWFYFAIIRRESTFDRCKTQPESAPNKDWGRGLTQVTFPWFAGQPYPQHLATPDNNDADWRSNIGINASFGPWIDMKDITPIPSVAASEADCRNNPKSDDAYDPKTNIDRFSTGFAAPAYHLAHTPGESPEETLRKVAWHWHYGIYGGWAGSYPNDPRPYLTCANCYDSYVNQYKAGVEAEDGVWQGPTCKPPYTDAGC